MNSAARKFAKALEEDIQAKGGIKDFRIHALKNLELKTIIRVWSSCLINLWGFINIIALGNVAGIYIKYSLTSFVNWKWIIGYATYQKSF